MHILITNDDGPPSAKASPFIQNFVEVLEQAGHVVSVCIPHEQRSWIGKAHFVGKTVQPTYYRPGPCFKYEGVASSTPSSDGKAWVLIDGTPATCVQLGIHHLFNDRGPIDLVLSGPNYGRNSSAVFSLSSGTIGGAMEGAVCNVRSIALSYAFFDRDHKSEVTDAASRHSLKVIEYLMQIWDDKADVYSINVPLVKDVASSKVYYTYILQNKWISASTFKVTDGEDADDVEEKEEKTRLKGEVGAKPKGEDSEEKGNKNAGEAPRFTWAPQFLDIKKTVEQSAPGNDAWAINQGYTSVTPLVASFMHVPDVKYGEIKLESTSVSQSTQTSSAQSQLQIHLAYGDPYVDPLIEESVRSAFSNTPYSLHASNSTTSLDPATNAPILHIAQYEDLDHEKLLSSPSDYFANSYTFRKALIRKHYLTHTIVSYTAKRPESILTKHIKPSVAFELDYAEFLDDALLEAFELHESFERNAEKEASEREWWILKPGMSDRGQGLELFSTEDELRAIFEKWEEDNPDLSDDEDTHSADVSGSDEEGQGRGVMTSQLRHFVAQQYISPLLLLGPLRRHKFHIRSYIVCIGALKVYVWKEMLALFAPVPYTKPGSVGSQDMTSHLTNTCLQTSSSEKSDLPETNPVARFWSLPSETLSSKKDTNRNWKDHVYESIRNVTAEVFTAASHQPTTFQPLPNAFEIFGVDWLVDEDESVFLLEVNSFPDFRQTGEGEKDVISGLWNSVIAKVAETWFDGASSNPNDKLDLVLDLQMGR